MESIAEKFTVYDFFNLLISGATSLLLIGICHFQEALKLLKNISKLTNKSSILLGMSIAVFMIASLILGALFQVIEDLIIKEKVGKERFLIENCLNEKGVFNKDNDLWRLKFIQIKAKDYLESPNHNLENFSKEESVAFFYHCVYYLHIKNIDKKAQKLDETKSLSAQFICTCIFAPTMSLFLGIFHLVKLSLISLYLYAACILGTCIFAFRYNIACKNRIKIVLSIYEAYNED